jgi:hypothetical protein
MSSWTPLRFNRHVGSLFSTLVERPEEAGSMRTQFLGAVAGVLLSAAVGVFVPAVAAPSGILTAFTPGDVHPGEWTLDVDEEHSPGLAPECPGRRRVWANSDGMLFALMWGACTEENAQPVMRSLELSRRSTGGEWQSLSVLDGAEVVEPAADNGIIRSWVQDDHFVVVGASCGGHGRQLCVDITGQATALVSSGLPGTASRTELLPSMSTFLGIAAVAWCLLVGALIWRERARVLRASYDQHHTGRRERTVDGSVRSLKRRHRWLRGCQAIAVFGGFVLTVQVVAVFATGAPASWGGVVVGLLAMSAAGVLAHRLRRPVATAAGSRWRALGVAVSVRRVLSLGMTTLLGVLALAFPLVWLAGVFFLGLVSPDANTAMLGAGGLFLAVSAGWLLDRGARRLRAYNARDLSRVDGRSPILYLRYFGDDQAMVTASGLGRRGLFQVATSWASIFRRSRFEEVMVRALAGHRPVVAVDTPDQRLRRLRTALRESKRHAAETGVRRLLNATHVPQLGAARIALDDDRWQAYVEQEANSAYAVVMAASPTIIGRGLRWEIDLVADRVGHGRVVLIVGPHDEHDETVDRLRAFLAEGADHPLFAGLIDCPPSNGILVLVHVPSEGWGTWYGWSARYRTAWTYTAAIDEALEFARTAWEQNPVTLDPFRGTPVSVTVRTALALAAERNGPDEAVGTADLLRAIAETDTSMDWQRIWPAASRSAAHDGPRDPQGASCIRFGGVAITGACEQALNRSALLSRRYRRTQVPAAVVALALVHHPRSAAFLALQADGPDGYQALQVCVWSDVLSGRLWPAPAPIGDDVRQPTTPAPIDAPPVATDRRGRRMMTRHKVLSAVAVCVAGWAFISVARDEGRSELIPMVIWAMVVGPVLLYAVGRHVACHRSGLIAAASGTAGLLTMATVAFLVEAGRP